MIKFIIIVCIIIKKMNKIICIVHGENELKNSYLQYIEKYIEIIRGYIALLKL